MITEKNYIDAANFLKCEVKVIKTVAAIESRGRGFLDTGEVRILFEPHIFWDQLIKRGQDPAKILKSDPDLKDILYKKWKTYPYGKDSQQWNRLRRAAQVDINAAHMSASYGKFQIMGFNHKYCGYANIFEFVHWMNQGEDKHLEIFVDFIFSKRLDKYLRSKDWTAFAKAYNGEGYHQYTATKIDDYDYKLNAMYNKLK